MPASEVYDEAGILTITPGSTNPQITERGMKDLFRMCGRDDQQGAIAANYMLDVLKAKKIAVIHDKDTYGQGWPMPPARRWRSGAPKKCCTKASPAVKRL